MARTGTCGGCFSFTDGVERGDARLTSTGFADVLLIVVAPPDIVTIYL
jgi:hypothetical protein